MTFQDGRLLPSIRAVCMTFALASLGLLLTSCISIHWTTEEEAKKQAELLKRFVSNEEVGWDATEVLKNLRSMRIALEASPRRRHAHILSKQVLSPDDEREIQKFLTDVLHFSRTVAETKAVLDMFSISFTPSNTIISSTADSTTLLQELDRVFIKLDPEHESKAFAFFDSTGRLAPRIGLSVGMLRELTKLGQNEEERLASIISLEQDIRKLPERNGFKVVRNGSQYTGRYMDLHMGNIDAHIVQYEYVSSVIFAVAHELAHATYDRFNPSLHAQEWTEIRADLLGVFVAETVMREAQTKNSAATDVLKGGFHTDDPGKIIQLASDAGYQIFLNVYHNTSFAEGDKSHLPIDKRKELLESAYKAMFNKDIHK